MKMQEPRSPIKSHGMQRDKSPRLKQTNDGNKSSHSKSRGGNIVKDRSKSRHDSRNVSVDYSQSHQSSQRVHPTGFGQAPPMRQGSH